MINFIQPKQENQTFKTWLYSPGGVFQGELLTINPGLKLNLEGVPSEFSFELPENIMEYVGGEYVSVVNPRVNDVLDQFQIEVWYGDLEKVGATPQKSRFIITKTPNSFANEKVSFVYTAYSKEYEMKSVKVLDWLGVPITEYRQTFLDPAAVTGTVSLTMEAGRTPRNEELIRVVATKNIVYRIPQIAMLDADIPFVFNSQLPINIVVKNATTDALFTIVDDYTLTVEPYTGITTLLLLTGAGKIPSGTTVYLDYEVENPITKTLFKIDNADTMDENSFKYNAGVITFEEITLNNVPSPLSFSVYKASSGDVTYDVYYELVDESLVTFNDTNSLVNVTKDGLYLEQVLQSLTQYGDEENGNGKWSYFVHSELLNEVRSGFKFNNTTQYAALTQTALAFDAVMLYDTINKEIHFYDREVPGTMTVAGDGVAADSGYKQTTGLRIEYGKYLKTISQDINSADIVTVMRGIGYNNLSPANVTPTGYNEYENYDYYIDGITISNWDAIYSEAATVPTLSGESRWFSTSTLIKLLLWLRARDYIELTTTAQSTAQEILGEQLIKAQAEFVELRLEESLRVNALTIFNGMDDTSMYEAGYGTTLETAANAAIAARVGYDLYIAQIEEAIDDIQVILVGLWAQIKKDDYVDYLNKQGSVNISTAYNFIGANFEELNSFRREGIFQNKFITKQTDLLVAMKEDLLARNEPVVTCTMSTVGILQTTDAQADWDSLILGGLAHLSFPRLNIEKDIQIKTIVISPQTNQTAMTFSTEKDFMGIGARYLGKAIATNYNTVKNSLSFREDEWDTGVSNASDAADAINNGQDVGDSNSITTPTLEIASSIKAGDYIVDPADSSIVTEGNVFYDSSPLAKSTIEYGYGRITIDSVTPNNNNIQVIMGANGFTIQKDGEEQMVIDDNGNAIFKGLLFTLDGETHNIDELNNYHVILSGGTYGYEYAADGLSHLPATSAQFTAKPKRGPIDWSTPMGQITYAWSATGGLSGTSTVATFTPIVNANYANFSGETSITLTTTFKNLAGDTTLYTYTQVYPVAITKVGEAGAGGATGSNAYLHIAYANLGVSPWTGFDKTDSVDKKYIGQVSNNTADDIALTATNYVWTLIKGGSIAGVVNYYLASAASTGVTTVTAGWTTTIQTVTEALPYLWNYEKITFDDLATTDTPPAVIGNYSADGRGIVSVTEYYALSTTTVEPLIGAFSTVVPTLTSTNKYLWNYEKITYTDAATSTTDAVIIGVYGDESTVPGPDGLGVINGMVYSTGPLTSAPATPTNGNTPWSQTGWSFSAPTFLANAPGDYYYSSYTGIETSAGSGIYALVFSGVQITIGFSGLVTFSGAVNDPISSANSNITSIDGGLLKTSVIRNSNWGVDAALEINMDAATITAQNFSIDGSGNVITTGTINATAGTFNNAITVGTNASKIRINGTAVDTTTNISSGTNIYGAAGTGFYMDASGRFSLGDKLSWSAGLLNIKGDIGGNIGQITIAGTDGSSGITISATGIEGKDSGGLRRFFIDANTGSGEFKGTITADEGTIGGWNIGNNLSSPTSYMSSTELWFGTSSNGDTQPGSLLSGEASVGINSLGAIGVYHNYLGSLSSNQLSEQYMQFETASNNNIPYIASNRDLHIRAGSTYTDWDATAPTYDLYLEADDNVILRGEQGGVDTTSSTNGVYAWTGDLGIAEAYGGPVATTSFDISSRFVKKDIINLEDTDIHKMLDIVEFKEYYNAALDDKEMCIIIEDEAEKDTALSRLFLKGHETTMLFSNKLPSWLMEHEEQLLKEDRITYKEKAEEKQIFVRIPTLEMKSYTTAAFASAKYNHKRIKRLEEVNKMDGDIITMKYNSDKIARLQKENDRLRKNNDSIRLELKLMKEELVKGGFLSGNN
jgi:hypothetical protein